MPNAMLPGDGLYHPHTLAPRWSNRCRRTCTARRMAAAFPSLSADMPPAPPSLPDIGGCGGSTPRTGARQMEVTG